jgi:hypothetical protein
MQSVENLSLASWKEELAGLVASAKTEEDIAALTAFERALSPYLDEPGALRTLLGKIQAETNIVALDAIMTKGEFRNLEEVKSMLPSDIEVVLA